MSAMQLHVKPEFNYEEAAHAASEIVMNLEGLPGEVSFLLEELREKDQRIDALLSRIHSRHYGLTKHVAKLSISSSSNNPSPQLPLPPNSPLPTDHLTSKENQAIQKIQSEWDKIEILQDEKVKLADRMERIVARARERARAEWVKVGGLDIEELGGEWDTGSVGGEIVLPASGLGSGSDIRQRKRRPQALPLPLPSSSSNPIIHPASSMAPPPLPSTSRRTHPPPMSAPKNSRTGSRRKQNEEEEFEEADADGEEEDLEGGEAVEDDGVYCICTPGTAGGEMVGCDNAACPVAWYHTECVGLTAPLPDIWYCADCVNKLGLSSSSGGNHKSHKDKKNRRK